MAFHIVVEEFIDYLANSPQVRYALENPGVAASSGIVISSAGSFALNQFGYLKGSYEKHFGSEEELELERARVEDFIENTDFREKCKRPLSTVYYHGKHDGMAEKQSEEPEERSFRYTLEALEYDGTKTITEMFKEDVEKYYEKFRRR